MTLQTLTGHFAFHLRNSLSCFVQCLKCPLNNGIHVFSCQVSEIYKQVHQSMSQAPIKDNVPFFWSTMSQVKSNHYLAMAHFFVASALVDHQCKESV